MEVSNDWEKNDCGGDQSKKYPNEWLFIIEPKTRENTTHLVSGIVQVHSKSRDDV